MAQRDKQFGLRVVALAGAVFVLLVVDLVVMTLIVRPSDLSTRSIPTGLSSPATQESELALILPTRDPRTPWPTKTPTPTATPWLISTATPELPPPASVLAGSTSLPQSTLASASPVLTESAAVLQTTVAPATSLQTESTVLPRSSLAPAPPSPSPKTKASALVTSPTPALGSAAVPSLTPDTGASSPSETPGSSPTSVSGTTETPTTAPGETPTATPSATPPPTPPDTLDDLPDFEAFMRHYRNTIAGQSFDVVSLGVDRTNATLPRFVLEVAGSEAKDVFAAQSAADLLDYGRRFLDDGQRYLGGAYCAVVVQSTYATSNSDACSNAPAWCQVGAHDEASNTWTVTWSYVRGNVTEGSDTVEAWNAGS